VTFYTIKADRVGDFLAAAKEFAEVARKGGSERSFSVWSSLTGPREYALVRYHAKWAELDQTRESKLDPVAGHLAAINARIVATVESSRRVISEVDVDLGLPIPATAPAMARVIRTWVRPEHVAAYRALYKAEVLPAAKKAGLSLFSVSHVRFGGATTEFNSVAGFSNWAALDGDPPIVTAMGGPAAYEKFLAKLRPLIERSEYEMYRLMKDQSNIIPMR